jgi:beta-galactosidase GanA
MTRKRKIFFTRPLLAFLVLKTIAAQPCVAQQLPSGPHLRPQGTATQLIVEGKPFLVLGGELGNSSSSSLEYMAPIWDRLVKLNLNTVLVPVSWELIEPSEGKFDFTLVDGLVAEARKRRLRLVPLWFGTWKNSMSCYAPDWVKTNQQRFPRAEGRDGRGMEMLSVFDQENVSADARAFAALMRHIKDIDSQQQTVIMVQVENEVGMIPDSRDRSAIANKLFSEVAPKELLNYLGQRKETLIPEFREVWGKQGYRSTGTWEEVFGKEAVAEEIFMAWHYARYVERVTTAGKREYPLPMFANAALIRPGYTPGQYPSAGPLPHLMDVWRAGAPSIDFLSPDIYFQNFAEWCRKYDRSGNAFFIPEAGAFPAIPVNVLYAIGQHNAIGVSPFAIESLDEQLGGRLASAYDILSQLSPLILANNGKNAIRGLLSEGPEQREPQRLSLNGYRLNVAYEKASGAGQEIPLTGGLVIATAPNEFFITGTGLTVTFEADSPGDPLVGLLSVDEGRMVDGRWMPGRRLNGDQTHQGRHVRIPPGRFEIQRVRLYRYR